MKDITQFYLSLQKKNNGSIVIEKLDIILILSLIILNNQNLGKYNDKLSS